MGDNIYLGDRDGVRTPMQWTGDRNGGFSRADFAQLYLPPLMDPVYGYQAVNVEAQLRTPTSLLRWMHRFIALRKEHPVFALGSYEPLRPANPRILAHIRRYEGEIAALRPQPRALRPGGRARPVALRGARARGDVRARPRSRAIGELPYLLTLRRPRLLLVPAARGPRNDGRARTVVVAEDGAARVRARAALVRAASERSDQRSSLLDQAELRADRAPRRLLVEVRYGSGIHDSTSCSSARDGPGAVGRRSTRSDDPGGSSSRSAPLLARRRRRRSRRQLTGSVEFCALGGLCTVGRAQRCAPLGPEQSNSSVVVDERADRQALPAARGRRQPGARAAAVPRRAPDSRTRPELARLVGLHRVGASSATLGIVQRFLAGAVDGWSLVARGASGPTGGVPSPGSARLGEVIGDDAYRARLRRRGSRPSPPRRPSRETIAAAQATVDDEIAQVFDHLPDTRRSRRSPACGDAVRDLLRRTRHRRARWAA